MGEQARPLNRRLDAHRQVLPRELQHVQLRSLQVRRQQQLLWQDNCDGEDGFKIDRKVGDMDWELCYGCVAEFTSRQEGHSLPAGGK